MQRVRRRFERSRRAECHRLAAARLEHLSHIQLLQQQLELAKSEAHAEVAKLKAALSDGAQQCADALARLRGSRASNTTA